MVVRHYEPPEAESKNLFFWRADCDICPKVWKALEISQINHKLPKERKIIPKRISTFSSIYPVNRLAKRYGVKGTPTVVLDGIKYDGGTTPGYFKGVFEEHFKEDVLPWLQ